MHREDSAEIETYRDQSVQGHKNASLPEPVRAVGDDEGVDGASDVRRGGEEQAELVRISLTSENDRKEVGERITLHNGKGRQAA